MMQPQSEMQIWWLTELMVNWDLMVNWAAIIFQSNKTCRPAPAVRRAVAKPTADVQHLNDPAQLFGQINTNTLLTFCGHPGLRPALSSTMHSVWTHVEEMGSASWQSHGLVIVRTCALRHWTVVQEELISGPQLSPVPYCSPYNFHYNSLLQTIN